MLFLIVNIYFDKLIIIPAFFLHQYFKIINRHRFLQIIPRDTLTDTARGGYPLSPIPKQGTHTLPYKLIQSGNKAILLKQRDKLSGRHKSPLRMNPSHQRLSPCHPFILHTVFGLKVNHKLILSQRRNDRKNLCCRPYHGQYLPAFSAVDRRHPCQRYRYTA